eukprot:910235-Rhodomonas_salina.1
MDVVGADACPITSVEGGLASHRLVNWCLESRESLDFAEYNHADPKSACMMTRALGEVLDGLERLVSNMWPGTHVRVIEAWSRDGGSRLHREGRAVDVIMTGEDLSKLGDLAQMAL